MTRRNTSILHSIYPEIDKTYHRLVRQNRTVDTNFVSVSEHPVVENTTFEHCVSVHSEYSDFVHSVAFPNSDHSVHSENMAQPPTPPGPHERTLRELAAPDFTYDRFCQDPHEHLKEFHIVCSTMKPNDVMEDHICLKAFPHSLEGPIKDWLYYLAPGSITSWGDLKRSFLGKFFPASRTTAIRKGHICLRVYSHQYQSRDPRLSERFSLERERDSPRRVKYWAILEDPRLSERFSPEREILA
ncbi:hypothetical protein Lal_00018921 [Lupinus albus]|nr:hypothetical protein Lal_00018921 [Lupinus albus]